MQYLIAAYSTYRRDGKCYDASQNRTIKYIFSHLVNIICTKIFCNWNAKACATSHTETKDKKLNAAAGSNSRQSLVTQYLSHYSSIYDIVSLLKQIAEQKWQGKLHHQTKRFSGNHGLSHVLHLPYIIDRTVSCQFYL